MKSLILASLLGAASVAHATPTKSEPQLAKRVEVPPVTVSGNAFYADGKRFFVRGVDYQPGGSSANSDPMADPVVCKRDLEHFKALNINTVRVYSTDNTLSHEECMHAFAEAGIYLLLDVNNPKYSINRDDPAPSYNADYLQSVFATMEEFAQYSNTMAFFSGNEVVHDHVNTTLAARYVKAVTRDMRGFLVKRGLRRVPVGYSAADVSQNRMQLAHYFNCGSDDERSDFFAFNDYSWCTSDFKTAGWDVKVRNFTGYGLPIFLSEYGCIANVRDFGEVKALMGSEMTGVYSGGLMYEYTYEANKYGIVDIENGKVKERQPEYDNFKNAMKNNPAPTDQAGAASTTAAVSCPPVDPDWLISNTKLPALPSAAVKFFDSGAGKGPGLNGPGSQTNGPPEAEQFDAEPGSGFGGDSNSGSGTGASGNSGNGGSAGTSVRSSLYVTASVVVASLFATMLL